MRRCNMDGYEREWVPLPSLSRPDRRGLVNETAFIIFSATAHMRPAAEARKFGTAQLRDSFEFARAYVNKNSAESIDNEELDRVERREALALAGRLFNFFLRREASGTASLRPKFRGSGIITECEGDVRLGDNSLVEVKSGDRPFRSVDFRQMCVYMALDFAYRHEVFERLILLNPRRGIYTEISSEIFAREVAGQSAVSFCQSLIETFSAHLVSE